MRILAIRGQNLASLAGTFEIPLDQPPLSDTGLFAITGATGSGKSTLLDALCLALYDQTPRFTGRSQVRITVNSDAENPDTLSTSDARHILRRGCGQGFAEVDFLGVDDHSYRARWSVRRARNQPEGKFQKPEMSLLRLDGDQSLGSHKKEETKALIEEKLGLNFDQFCRSVLLAQGDFAAFLKAEPDARAALLERMTGTEIYKLISIQTHEHFSEAKRKWQSLQDQLGHIQVLDEDARLALESQEAELKVQLQNSETRKQVLQHAFNWYQTQAKLQTALTEAQQQLQQRQTQWQEQEPLRQELALLNKVQPLRDLFEQRGSVAAKISDSKAAISKLETQLEQADTALKRSKTVRDDAEQKRKREQLIWDSAQADLEQAQQLDSRIEHLHTDLASRKQQHDQLNDQLRTDDGQLEQLRQRIDDLKQSLQDGETWQQEHAHWCALERDAAHWLAQIEALDTTRKQLRAAQDQAQEQQGLKQQLQDQQQQLLDAFDQEQQKIQKLQEQRDQLQAQLDQQDLQALQQEIDQTQAQLENTQAAIAWHKDWQQLQAEKTRIDQEQQSQQVALDQARETEAQQVDERKQVAAQLDEARRSLERLQATQDLASKRHLLQADQPCPLCGATEHPYAQETSPLDDLLQQQRQRVVALDEQVRQIDKALGRAQETQEHCDGALFKLEQQAASYAQRIQDHQGQALSEWQQGELSDWQAAHADLNESLQSKRQAQRQREGQRQQFDQLGRQIQQLQTPLQGKSQQIQQLQTKAALAQQQAEQATEQAAQLAATLPKQLEAFAPVLSDEDHKQLEAGTFAETAQQRIATVRQKQQDLASAKADLDKTERDLAVVTSARGKTAEQLEGIDVQMKALQGDFDQLKQQRHSMLRQLMPEVGSQDLITVASCKSKLQAAIKQAEAALDQATKQGEAAHMVQQQRRGQLDAEKRLLAEREQALQQSETKLQTKLERIEMEESQVQELLRRAPEWLAEQLGRVDQLQQQLQQSETIVAERLQQLQAHSESDAPEMELEALQTQLAELEETMTAQRELEKEFHAQLSDDRKQRGRAAEHLQTLALAEAELNEWQALHDLIGSSDGKKFRKFAQSVTLDMLLQHANHHLDELTPRYRLQRVPDQEMAIQVIDTYMADEIRSVNSLSGGESFLVSLALALGLASLSSRGSQIGSLFIDEGFGTLDAETLEIALSALDALQASGRQVGIISHVVGIAERIGVRIVMERTGQDASRPRIEM